MNGQERGWRTITGFVVLAIGGVLLALSTTSVAPIEQEVAFAVVSLGAGLAGVGDRLAKGKQLKATNAQTAILEQVLRAAGGAKPGGKR